MMKKAYILLLALILTSLHSYSQFYYIPKSIDGYTPSSCTNAAIIEGFNLPNNGHLEITNGNNVFGELMVDYQDTVYLCSYPEGYLANQTVHYFASNGYINTYFLYSTIITPHFYYSISNFTPPSSSTSQDGSLVINFDSTSVIENYTIEITQNNGITLDTTILNSYSIQIDSLKETYLQFYITNPLNPADYCKFRVYVGNPDDFYANSGLEMSLSLQHASNNCEGWINLVPVNASGQTYNIWDGGTPYNQVLRTALCPGIYSAHTYEIIQGGYGLGSIDTIVISNENTSFIDSSIYLYTPQDTAYYNFENCMFDYSNPIDSLTYTEDTLVNIGGVVIVNYYLTLYQGNNSITVTDSLVMINDSIISLDVVLYCDELKAPFISRLVKFLRGVDDHIFYQNGVGILEENFGNFSLYPNPVNDLLNLDFAISSSGQITIYDVTGAIVLTHDFVDAVTQTIPLQDFPSGMYLLSISTDTFVQTRKFVKD